jgi:hypothetical protein
MLLSEGQMSDHKGASLVLEALPPAKTLIADSAPFRQGLSPARAAAPDSGHR